MFSMRSSRCLRKLAMLLFISLKGCIHHLIYYHKPEKKYDEMVGTDQAKIDPSLLPSSPRAVYYHGLRTYDQIKVWKALKELRNYKRKLFLCPPQR